MGAVLASEAVAATLRPGDHATTFGGGPFVSTVALAVVRAVTAPDFLAGVAARGERLGAGLDRLASDHPSVKQARGVGLMRGLALEGEAGPVVARARDAGLLVLTAGPDVVRLLPPLVVTDDQVDRALEVLEGALG